MDTDDTVFLFEDFLGAPECQPYIDRIQNHWDKHKSHSDSMTNWPKRTIDITDDPIVQKVTSFLKQKFSCRLECSQAQIQIWPQNYDTGLHKHIDNGRENTDFNSLIYLNDAFEGGEFYTEKGVTYKPKTGALTFFNGSTVVHGVKKVLGCDRYTLIFWWKRPTVFYEKVFMMDDFLDAQTCAGYIQKYKDKLTLGPLRIEDKQLEEKVKSCLRENFGAVVGIQSLLFTRISTTHDDSELHIHNWEPKRCGCHSMVYNAVIYLNDDFENGEFYTKEGVLIRPKVGRMIFFNVSIWHGIKKVLNSDRYSIRITCSDPVNFT